MIAPPPHAVSPCRNPRPIPPTANRWVALTGAVALAAGLAGGCVRPNALILSGDLTTPALTSAWLSHDDATLLLVTPTHYWLVDVALATLRDGGTVTPGTTVWVSPASDHFAEVVVPVDGQPLKPTARVCQFSTGQWTATVPLADNPRSPWAVTPAREALDPTEPAALRPAADNPPPDDGPQPDLPLGPRLPRAGEIWPADATNFWLAALSGRVADPSGQRLFDLGIRGAQQWYQQSRSKLRWIDWCRPGRPVAPMELTGPRRVWRIHIQPVWSETLDGRPVYELDIQGEQLRTGQRRQLVGLYNWPRTPR